MNFFFQKKLTTKASVIVDICCGRGGDLKKYIKNHAQIIIGIDNVSSLLYSDKNAALSRWTSEYLSQSVNNTNACFVLADARQPLCDTLGLKSFFFFQFFTQVIIAKRGLNVEADVISCFFAIHYFFSTEKDCRSFFQNVSDLLKADGIFIGTVIDGELLYNKLNMNNNKYCDKNPDAVLGELFSIEPKNFDTMTMSFHDIPSFGAGIDVFIRDSIVEDYVHIEEKNGQLKQECMVKFSTLQSIASDFDLILGIHSIWSLHLFNTCKTEESETFDQYFPDFPNIQMSNNVAEFSSLHRTFCFRKISRSKQQNFNIGKDSKITNVFF